MAETVGWVLLKKGEDGWWGRVKAKEVKEFIRNVSDLLGGRWYLWVRNEEGNCGV